MISAVGFKKSVVKRYPVLKAFGKDVNLLKTFYCNLKCRNWCSPVLVYPKARVYIGPNAKIAHKGGFLHIGRRWNVERFRHTELILRENAIIEIHDTFSIYSGCFILVEPGGRLILGKGGMNHNVRIVVVKSIRIGHNSYLSDYVTLRDSDNHPIGASLKNHSAPIIIGDNVLVGLNSTILKGVTIGDGAVVAAGSVVTRSVPPKALVGGAPAKVLRENVTWHI